MISLDFTGLTNGELGKELWRLPNLYQTSSSSSSSSSSGDDKEQHSAAGQQQASSSRSLELEFGKEGWRRTRAPGAVRVIPLPPLLSPHGSSVPGLSR